MLKRAVLAVSFATAGLLVSCEGVCGCLAPPPMELVYGRVESAAGTGIPTAVVLYRLAPDTVCILDDQTRSGEIDVRAEGRFRDAIYSGGHAAGLQCLELRAFDPAAGKADTVSILIFVDFGTPDSTGVVLRLP